jgi:translation elongation factor EF-4
LSSTNIEIIKVSNNFDLKITHVEKWCNNIESIIRIFTASQTALVAGYMRPTISYILCLSKRAMHSQSGSSFWNSLQRLLMRH